MTSVLCKFFSAFNIFEALYVCLKSLWGFSGFKSQRSPGTSLSSILNNKIQELTTALTDPLLVKQMYMLESLCRYRTKSGPKISPVPLHVSFTISTENISFESCSQRILKYQ